MPLRCGLPLPEELQRLVCIGVKGHGFDQVFLK